MKIATYNVNGVRAALKKGLLEWLDDAQPDVLCLQEVKALEQDVDLTPFRERGYAHIHWFPAQKKGYSGVATLSKIAPSAVHYGLGHAQHDAEGRLLRTDFGDLTLINAYFPSGSSGEERQAYKYEWLRDFQAWIDVLRQTRPQLLIGGDVNICHRPIDIHNPVANKNTSGFLPEERAWVDEFLASGFVDAFRQFSDTPHQYTWWTYRAGARERNVGWRIDYFFASQALAPRLRGCTIHPEAKQSDHCPVMVALQ
jgi:exodeoxyribonuclease-3